eukprot:1195304-Alexandrium_andersonii.AAC.1
MRAHAEVEVLELRRGAELRQYAEWVAKRSEHGEVAVGVSGQGRGLEDGGTRVAAALHGASRSTRAAQRRCAAPVCRSSRRRARRSRRGQRPR